MLILPFFPFSFPGTIRTLATLDLESKPSYWLTVCAQDQAVVPLHSCVQVSRRFLSDISGRATNPFA